MAGENGIMEREVFEQVTKEIKAFGTDLKGIKDQVDELNRSYKAAKDEIEKVSSDKGKLAKYQEDMVTRQEALDKTIAETGKRLDDIEVALKRPGRLNPDNKEAAEVLKKATEHMMNCMTSQGNGSGVSFEKLQSTQPDLEAYANYVKAFESYLRKDDKHVSQEFFKTLSVGVDPHGGYTVTPYMATQILTRMYESDPIRQLAQTMSISTDAVEWLVDRDQADVGWEGETNPGVETGTPNFGKKRISVNTIYAKPHATQQLLEDSAINIESWLANKIGERIGRFEGTAFVTGDGVNKPRGLLTYPNGTNWGQIEQVAMGAAATITADGFIRIKYHLMEQFLNSGTWLMNRLTLMDTMLLKDGTGNYIWKPSAIAADPSSSILGLPVRMSTTMPSVAANSLSVILADFRETYMIVDRLGITVQRDPYTVKPFVEFYTRKRLGADVINYDSIKIGIISV